MATKKKTTVTKRSPAKRRAEGLDFAALVEAIGQVHAHGAAAVNRVVNLSLTLRNWVIGGHIHHYELNGRDRAKYGDAMMDRLAVELARHGVTACERQCLYAYLAFFSAYPQIGGAVPSGALNGLWLPVENDRAVKARSTTGKSGSDPSAGIVRSLTGQLAVTGWILLDGLSYTHLELLTAIEDPLKRAFYEIECIRGNRLVRALRRQIATLYFERWGLSKDKERLSQMVRKGVETAEPALAIRDPYIFEFLGLRAGDAAVHRQASGAGAIRDRQHGQPHVRFQICRATAGQGRAGAVPPCAAPGDAGQWLENGSRGSAHQQGKAQEDMSSPITAFPHAIPQSCMAV